MGDACAVAGAICCRVFTAADPDQIYAAQLKWRVVRKGGVTLRPRVVEFLLFATNTQ
jgi:hypothetical protein